MQAKKRAGLMRRESGVFEEEFGRRADHIPVGAPAKFRLLPDLPILGSTPFSCKFTYCFCAHMHEIVKYFILTEIQEQYLYFPEI